MTSIWRNRALHRGFRPFMAPFSSCFFGTSHPIDSRALDRSSRGFFLHDMLSMFFFLMTIMRIAFSNSPKATLFSGVPAKCSAFDMFRTSIRVSLSYNSPSCPCLPDWPWRSLRFPFSVDNRRWISFRSCDPGHRLRSFFGLCVRRDARRTKGAIGSISDHESQVEPPWHRFPRRPEKTRGPAREST